MPAEASAALALLRPASAAADAEDAAEVSTLQEKE